MTQVRVMTYNILMGGQSGAALHEVIRESKPDVLLVNETPKSPVLWKRQCRKLAEKWGMRWIVGGREAGSNMIAISERIGVKSFDAYTLWTPPFRPRRGIATAQLRIEGRLFAAVSCHLSLERERRVDDVERVIEAANRLRGPVVLGGDLNQPPGQWSWRRLRQVGFVDCGSDEWLTFPAASPEKRIDALLVRGNAKVIQHGDPGVPLVLQSEASDHRPVLAVLDL